MPRILIAMALVVTFLLAGCRTASPPPPAAVDTSASSLQAIGSLHDARAAHSATLLNDGTVLIVGGFATGEAALASAELYDPGSDSFRQVASLGTARHSHSATRLADGRVLIAGGQDGDRYLASAELYDPATGRFEAVGQMNEGRSSHAAVLLDDGRVLLIGGTGFGWSFLASAELYDPATQRFLTTGSMAVPRESHTATRLADGRVLVVGGHVGRRSALRLYASAELYDPQQGRFQESASLMTPRHKHDAVLLADGRVLISGGSDERDSAGTFSSTALFDPATKQFSEGAEMTTPRYKHTGTSVLLADGRIVILGGARTVEWYDTTANLFKALAPSLDGARLFATATALQDGSVVLIGGYSPDVSAATTAWRFVP